MYTPYNQSMYGTQPSNMYGYLPTIGHIGYNGGYYTNNYNTYNPYLIRQQQEAYQKQLQEQQQQQYNINCLLHRMANSYYGEDYVEPSVQDYSEYYYYAQKELQEVSEYEHLAMLTMNLQAIEQQQQQQKRDSIRYPITIQEQEAHNKDSIYDFLNSAGELYVKALENEYKEKDKERYNLQNLYNHNSYNQLVNMHNNSANRFNAYSKDFSIDDMEISLPKKFDTEYQRRKQQFLDQILSKGNFANG